MEEKLLATYKRKSTLWKNANMFYRLNDWCKMECLYITFEEERAEIESGEVTYFDHKGNNISDKIKAERYTDHYTIRLTNEYHTNSQGYHFKTKDEANDFFKEMLDHPTLNGWKKV